MRNKTYKINSTSGGDTSGLVSFPEAMVFEIKPSVILPGVTQDVIIKGAYFSNVTTVTIDGQPINSTTIVSDSEIIINVTASVTEDFHDVIIDNGTTYTLDDAIEIKASTWVDLREGGEVLTIGNAAGNDIRHQIGITTTRTSEGLGFTGTTPWSSWVKFESLGWTRGEEKTLEYIMTAPTANFMIGIGSDATDETSASQYLQAEIEAYFNATGTLWGLYGNNGTVGGTANQSSSVTISDDFYKLKFTNDGKAGGTFELYGLQDGVSSSWDDETNLLHTIVIGTIMAADEVNLLPMIVPQSGTQRFLALKVT